LSQKGNDDDFQSTHNYQLDREIDNATATYQ